MTRVKNVTPYVFFGVGIAGVTFLTKDSHKEKIITTFHTLKEKAMKYREKKQQKVCQDVLIKAGHPDPYDIEDSRMVDEGGIYCVHYYNQKMHG
ncbi:hypothetical protein [Bacillus sp. CECT 9360]|uniref:hypothetical protein n=1 Tax=Bacillus sp. CECT 9360 TaxID=2845821 RepID=UPI001E470E3F|nr:hypothetical protein [Bacillus sp. CECT 9360]CAH0346035.1 hypothetical protein BCI9360_02347 [Bacillus sp. CECT 9360]